MFSGVLKCPECGGNLNFHFNQGNHDIKFFSCQNHNSGLRKCSKTHYIRVEFLEQVVLYEVNRLAHFANEYEDDFIKAMMGQSAKVADNDRVRKQRELDGLLARDRELDVLFEKIYEDNASGRLSDERFDMLSQSYESEQKRLEAEVISLRQEIEVQVRQSENIEKFIQTTQKYVSIETLDPYALRELVQAIYVEAPDKSSGKRRQSIHIKYDGLGFIPLDELMKKETA